MPRHRNQKNNSQALTVREQRFIEEYPKDWNGTHAAIRAGYSKNGASRTASVLLAKPKVIVILNKLKQELAAENKIDAAWLLNELLDRYKVAKERYEELVMLNKADVKEIFNKDGTLMSIHNWPDHWRQKQMIQQIEVMELEEYDPSKKKKVLIGYLKKVRSHDLKAAETRYFDVQNRLQDMIGRHVSVGAFKDILSTPGTVRLIVEYTTPRGYLPPPASEQKTEADDLDALNVCMDCGGVDEPGVVHACPTKQQA